jgi:hypothetical protein
MKIHTNFISNSSSTSFLIIYKKPKIEKCSCCKRKFEDFLDLVEKRHIDNEDNEVLAKGYKDVEIYAFDNYFYDGNEEEFHKLNELIKNNKNQNLAFVEISNHETELREKLFSNEVEVLWNDEI